MPLMEPDPDDYYVIGGTSDAVRNILQSAWVVKAGRATKAGWDRLAADLARGAAVDEDLLSSAGEKGILMPEFWVNASRVNGSDGYVDIDTDDGGGQTISIQRAENKDGWVEIVHNNEASDALFARILAAAILITPKPKFELRYGRPKKWRVVRPEVPLTRHLMERVEVVGKWQGR